MTKIMVSFLSDSLEIVFLRPTKRLSDLYLSSDFQIRINHVTLHHHLFLNNWTLSLITDGITCMLLT